MPQAQRHRVLFVSSTLSEGGAERFVSSVLARLEPSRFAPELALLRDAVSYPLSAEVPLHRLEKRWPWQLPRAVWRLARLVDATRPHAVVSAFAHPNLVTGCALGISRHAPRWIARVSSPPEATDPAPLRPLMRALYRRADRVVANAQALCEMVSARYAPPGGVAHLPNATDFTRIDALARESVPPPAGGRPRVVAVGRLAASKRFDLLLEAFAQLGREAELVICGEGVERARLERTVQRLGVSGRVRLPGFVANPFAWMASADVFALSSDVEGLPNALIEAQGLGIPAVATDCPTGPGEVIEHEVSGLLVAPGDASAFAGALAGLLGDAQRRSAMGAVARERVRAIYDVGVVTRSLEALLDSLSAA